MTAPNLPSNANCGGHETSAAVNEAPGTPHQYRLAAHFLDVIVAVADAASHDGLTGTLTKEVVKYRAQEMLDARKPLLIAFMDLDEFKPVNDTYGHAEGDRILAELGNHLVDSYRRKTDFVGHERSWTSEHDEPENESIQIGRIGGDEFMVAIDLTDRQRAPEPLTLDQRATAAKKYLENTVSDFVDQQNSAILENGFGASFGYAVSDPSKDGADLGQLMATADQEMYANKHAHSLHSRRS